MYRAIIVDDEVRIRKAIRSIGLWDELDVLICGEAENGVDTINLIIEHDPDIVFLDMNMPGMDGITTLKKLKSMNISINVIVVSGYDDFTYTKEAIKYGAFDYILKPINREEFNNTLKQCVQKIKNNQNNLSSNRDKLNRFAVEELITNAVLNGKTAYMARVKELFNHAGYESFAIVWIINAYLGNYDETIFDFYRGAQTVLEEESLIGDKNIYCIGTEKKDLVVVVFGLSAEAAKHKSLFPHRLHYFLEKMNKNQNIDCFEYKTVFINKAEDIIQEYNKVKKELCSIDLYSLFAGHDNKEYTVKSADIDWNMKNKLNILMQHKKFSIENICHLFSEQDASYMQEKTEFAFFVYNPYIIYNNLVSFNIDTHGGERIAEIIRYIDSHLFDSELTLDTIAQHMYLNKSYLARLFKSEFNITVGEYIQKNRLEHSVMLLKNTDLSIKDISVRSGYNNVNYFSRVFKSYYHVSPNQYRIKKQIK